MSQVLSTLNLSKSISISPVRPVINNYWMNEGVSCGAASVGEYNRVIYYYQESWQRKLATVKSLKANFSSVSRFFRAIGGIVGSVCVSMLKMELRYWWKYGDEKTREWKALVDTVEIKSTDLKEKFLL